MLKSKGGGMINRFQDKGKFLANAEYRFPLWKKLGGSVFIDRGACLAILVRNKAR